VRATRPSVKTIGPAEIAAASEAARGADEAVCALALDLLSRQAESRLLFAGKELVAKRAEEHGVEAGTEVGGEDVLALLERGPSNSREHALFAALAVAGLRAHLDEPKRLARFSAHADWLSLATPYAVHSLIDPVLAEDAGPVWSALSEGLPSGGSPRAVALRTLRAAALASSANPEADATLAKVRAELDVAEVVGVAAGGDEVPSLQGRAMRPPASGVRGVLRLVTGWAALQWLVRGLGAALRFSPEVDVRSVKGGLEIRRTTRLLGRVVREAKETYTYSAIAGGARTTRYPAAHLLLGALCFAVGVLVGGVWLFEGVRSGETVLLMAGAGAILIGGVVDVALGLLVPAKRGRGHVERRFLPKRRLAIAGIPEAEAERFLSTLSTRARR